MLSALRYTASALRFLLIQQRQAFRTFAAACLNDLVALRTHHLPGNDERLDAVAEAVRAVLAKLGERTSYIVTTRASFQLFGHRSGIGEPLQIRVRLGSESDVRVH